MKLKQILEMISNEVKLQLNEDGGRPGGANRVDARSKGTVGKVHKRKLKRSQVPARDTKAEKMFDKVADGGAKGRRVVKQAQKLAGAQGAEWPAGVWAMATDQTIKGKSGGPPKSGKSASKAKAGAKKAQKSAEKAVATGKTSSKKTKTLSPRRRSIKPGKTSKDPRQLNLFKNKNSKKNIRGKK